MNKTIVALASGLLLMGFGCAPAATLTVSSPAPDFVPDAGVRMEDASNPGVRVRDDGSVDLLFENATTHRPEVAEAPASSDGLAFAVTDTNADVGAFRSLELPDGTCVSYGYDPTKGISGTGLTSRSSTDCVTFVEDAGVRYELQAADKGSMGVWDQFVDSSGGVVLLYLGDLHGLNNVRRAYSTDNGRTFAFTNGNVFGDDTLGGGPNSYVDDKVLALPDGRFRAITMRQGSVYTFVSVDDGKTFSPEGLALSPSDFPGTGIVGFNDPQLALLPDGRERVYTTAQIQTGNTLPDGRRELKSVIVSATTNE